MSVRRVLVAAISEQVEMKKEFPSRWTDGQQRHLDKLLAKLNKLDEGKNDT